MHYPIGFVCNEYGFAIAKDFCSLVKNKNHTYVFALR